MSSNPVTAETPTITLTDLKFAINACVSATKRRQEAEAAEEIKAAAMSGIFERLLGVKSLEEVAAYSPEDIAALAKRRIKKGEVVLDGFELEKLLQVIQQSQAKRNIKWKEAFIAALGAAKAAEIEAATPKSYSYKAAPVL